MNIFCHTGLCIVITVESSSMNTKRILFGLIWLASVVIAFFAGSAAMPMQSEPPGSAAPSASRDGSAAGGAQSIVRKVDASEEDPGRREKANIPMLIAKARVELGSGMGGMMNLRGMFRAIAPLVELDDSQIQEALAEIERTTKEPQQKMMFYSILLGQWAEKDGKAALDYAEKNLKGNGMFDFGVKGSILGAWSRTNPDAAWRWFETEGKAAGNERNNMMVVSGLFSGMATNDLDTALARLDTLDDSLRPMALNGISMSSSSESARKRLLERTSTLPGKTRDPIRQSVLSQWAMMDSEAALKWLGTLPADEQKPLRKTVGQTLMMMNPTQGAELLLKDASEEEKPQLYDQAVQQWAFQDAKAAGEWLTKQPQGPELDNARMTYARVVASKEPAAAMDWAKSITKPESRDLSVQQVYQVWKPRDAKAADAALDSSGLAPETIDNIRKAKNSGADTVGVPHATVETIEPKR